MGEKLNGEYLKIEMAQQKNIVLVAHDNKKQDLLEWAKFNKDLLARHKLYATGTTGWLLERELGLEITKLHSGPLGGDQQIGAKIAEGIIDFLIFFLGPSRDAAARSGCEGPVKDCSGLDYPRGMQSGHRGFHDFLLHS